MPTGIYQRTEKHKATCFKKGHTINKGRKFSEEARKNMSKARKGKIVTSRRGVPLSLDHKRKISEAQKGVPRPYVKLRKGIKMSNEARKKMSLSAKGKKLTETTKLKISNFQKLRYNDPLVRKHVGSFHVGKKNKNWKGGITPVHIQIRNSTEYRLWRESVFERDNYTCVWCGTRGGKLNADHIKPFALFPELRLAIDNGRTLCVSCHRKTETWGGRTK